MSHARFNLEQRLEHKSPLDIEAATVRLEQPPEQAALPEPLRRKGPRCSLTGLSV